MASCWPLKWALENASGVKSSGSIPCAASRSRLIGVSMPGGPNSLIRLRCMMATSGGLPERMASDSFV